MNNGLLQYSQDYDETLPPVVSASQVEGLLFPYVKKRVYFVCPVTNTHYRIYTDLSSRPLRSFPDFASTRSSHDGAPHPDGIETLAYLDGHLERGGVHAICDDTSSQTDLPCELNVRQLELATAQCIQDYDDTLPDTYSYASFMAALYPHYEWRSQAFYCPFTVKRYAPNPAVSELPLPWIADPAETLLIKDHVPHNDGTRTFGWLDGHVSLHK